MIDIKYFIDYLNTSKRHHDGILKCQIEIVNGSTQLSPKQVSLQNRVNRHIKIQAQNSSSI